ncbi:MAG: hypothetical protein ACLVAU_04460 [Ruminococcus sp.]
MKFYTYAKLMLLSDENFSEIKPDYIILDEFHRCGAEYWGVGVQKLLEMYPDTPLVRSVSPQQYVILITSVI